MSKQKAVSETPPSPVYIFRGHVEQINSLEFIENNRYLISGDAGGNVIIWDMISRRSKIQFKAHNDGILSIVKFKDKLISHGRDNTLHVWAFGQLSNAKDESIKEESIKSEISLTDMNFGKDSVLIQVFYVEINDKRDELFIAVPSAKGSSGIDIWNLTNQKLIVSSIGLDQNRKTGYCMAIKIFPNNNFQNIQSVTKNYLILAAYENGSVSLWSITININDSVSNEDNVVVEKLWDRKEHGESVLSIDLSPNKQFAMSTSGDNKIVKYNFDEGFREEPLIQSTTVKYAGVAEVKIRSDGKIFATAGWDTMCVIAVIFYKTIYNELWVSNFQLIIQNFLRKRIRVFSSKSLKPLAILSYHRESVYALAFSCILPLDEQDHDKSIEEEKDLGSEERIEKHYLVGGGKDQRISLWEIY
ncbi:24470_t:CDS:2 [Cetraspora pellucida]|uniref:ASTRA-associated protein 1 n=1 Tax=Cetraspora pellucida TaxID=1433469 RepID=A0A9N8Z5Q4_9GLOM|nr:24470_t:CDS:2 [Cetraspora pellucida]